MNVNRGSIFYKLVLALSLAIPLQGPSYAADTELDMSLLSSQSNFSGLVRDIGAAANYKSLAPAEPLGLLGFDFSVEVSGTSVENKSALNTVTGGDAPSTIYVPKLHIHKGLPLGFDIGAFITTIPSSNIEVIGGQLSYAILEGSTIMPALSIRGTYSQLSGVDNFDLNTTGLELSISKGFAMFTPYAGVGTVRYSGETSVIGITEEKISETKYFLGLNFSLGLVSFAAETEQTGDNSTTSAKIGVRF